MTKYRSAIVSIAVSCIIISVSTQLTNARGLLLGKKCDKESCLSVFLRHLDSDPGLKNHSFTAVIDYAESELNGAPGKSHIESRDILCDGRGHVGFKGPSVSVRDGDEVTEELGMKKLLKVACNR